MKFIYSAKPALIFLIPVKFYLRFPLRTKVKTPHYLRNRALSRGTAFDHLTGSGYHHAARWEIKAMGFG
ncbi:MAG: hypothetical protein VXW48_14595, partial [Pseudomonadota bacterium]|nr:hypothetical protein [Pseudomonadota bacterium]